MMETEVDHMDGSVTVAAGSVEVGDWILLAGRVRDRFDVFGGLVAFEADGPDRVIVRREEPVRILRRDDC
jgi:hypothetical protein